jgi:DNA-binding PadR family transcriptional regulator
LDNGAPGKLITALLAFASDLFIPKIDSAMHLLTRPEEYVMLAIWKLQEDAYSIPIREQVSKSTGYEWSLSSVFTPLNRLSKKRLVTSNLTRPQAQRGGRHKRVYELTPEGRQALLHIRTVEDSMWAGVTGLALSGGTR